MSPEPGTKVRRCQEQLEGGFSTPRPPRRRRAEGDMDTLVAEDASAAAAAAIGAEAAADVNSGRSH